MRSDLEDMMSVAAADGGVSVREEAFIGGERCGAGDGSLSVVNPATGAAVGTVPVPGAQVSSSVFRGGALFTIGDFRTT